MKKIAIIVIMLLKLNSYSFDNISDIREVLKYVETNHNPLAIGDSGKSYGILQIQKICIDDVNRTFGTYYTHSDAFDIICSEEIFELYIQMLYNRFCFKYNREPNEEEIVRSWNGGIYSGYVNPKTREYFRRYKKWSKILEIRKLKRKFVSLKQINMNQFKFTGEITKVFDVAQGVSKAGNAWKRVDFVVSEVTGDFPQSSKFTLFGEEKVDNFMKYNKVGDTVDVSFNLKSREHEGNVYNSLDAWKVFKSTENLTSAMDTEDDDLPF